MQFLYHTITLTLLLLADILAEQESQLHGPDTHNHDNEDYQAPILNGGIGTNRDDPSYPQKTSRRYPSRNRNTGFDNGRSSSYYPGSAFRNNEYEAFTPNNNNRYYFNTTTTTTRRPLTTATTTTTFGRRPTSSTRDPFNDPNRYRVPQQQEDGGVRFVNGRPYR